VQTIYANDGFSRASIWMISMVDDSKGSPPPIDFQVRFSAECNSEILYQATIKAPSFKSTGLLVQLGGINATQVEVWARVPKSAANARPVQIRFHFMVDRIGDTIQSRKGNLVTDVVLSLFPDPPTK
jgi:hypothetical protein